MQPATVIARLIGPVFAVIGAGILVNPSFYQNVAAEAVQVPSLLYLYGVVLLAAGVAIQNFHREWTRDWRVIVTILGWLFMIGGLIRVLMPGMVQRLAPVMPVTPLAVTLIGVVVLAVGIYLTFEAYRPWR
jgi:drug/metabolite transporter (DMT)-like permease